MNVSFRKSQLSDRFLSWSPHRMSLWLCACLTVWVSFSPGIAAGTSPETEKVFTRRLGYMTGGTPVQGSVAGQDSAGFAVQWVNDLPKVFVTFGDTHLGNNDCTGTFILPADTQPINEAGLVDRSNTMAYIFFTTNSFWPTAGEREQPWDNDADWLRQKLRYYGFGECAAEVLHNTDAHCRDAYGDSQESCYASGSVCSVGWTCWRDAMWLQKPFFLGDELYSYVKDVVRPFNLAGESLAKLNADGNKFDIINPTDPYVFPGASLLRSGREALFRDPYVYLFMLETEPVWGLPDAVRLARVNVRPDQDGPIVAARLGDETNFEYLNDDGQGHRAWDIRGNTTKNIFSRLPTDQPEYEPSVVWNNHLCRWLAIDEPFSVPAVVIPEVNDGCSTGGGWLRSSMQYRMAPFLDGTEPGWQEWSAPTTLYEPPGGMLGREWCTQTQNCSRGTCSSAASVTCTGNGDCAVGEGTCSFVFAQCVTNADCGGAGTCAAPVCRCPESYTYNATILPEVFNRDSDARIDDARIKDARIYVAASSSSKEMGTEYNVSLYEVNFGSVLETFILDPGDTGHTADAADLHIATWLPKRPGRTAGGRAILRKQAKSSSRPRSIVGIQLSGKDDLFSYGGLGASTDATLLLTLKRPLRTGGTITLGVAVAPPNSAFDLLTDPFSSVIAQAKGQPGYYAEFPVEVEANNPTLTIHLPLADLTSLANIRVHPDWSGREEATWMTEPQNAIVLYLYRTDEAVPTSLKDLRLARFTDKPAGRPKLLMTYGEPVARACNGPTY